MKLLLTISLLFTCAFVFAQAPNAINYQAALRNTTGQPMASQSVTLRLGIYSGPGASTKVYEETHALTSTAQGIINCIIGNGSPTFGTMGQVQWGTTEFHLKVEVNSGSGFVDMGIQKLVSVPYSLYSAKSGSTDAISSNVVVPVSQLGAGGATTGQVLQWNGSSWIPATVGGSGSGDITDVIAGTGMTGGGTSGSVTINANTGSALWNANKLQSVDVTNTAPTNGQVLKYNGTAWAPANESALTAGTGLSVTGNVMNSVWTKSGNNIYNNNSAYVGIGNNAPQSALDVTGDAKLSGNLGLGVAPNTAYSVYSQQSSKDNIFYIENAGSSFSSAVVVKTTNGTYDNVLLAKYGSGVSGAFTDGTPFANSGALLTGVNGNRLLVGTTTSFPVHLMTNSTTRMYVDGAGNIGVNTTSPSARLHVVNSGTTAFTPPGSAFSHFSSIYGFSDSATASNNISAGVTGYGKGGFIGAGLSGIGGTTSVFNVGLYSQVPISPNVSGNRNYGIYNDIVGGYSFAIGIYNDVEATVNSTNGNYACFNTLTGTAAATSYAGYFSNTAANSTFTNIGVYATATNGGTNYAGYFQGNTHVNGTLSKNGGTFIIDHPQDPANKYLVHSFVESPDMMNIYNGNITTDANGFATVTLPSYFEAENIDFKYQLTVIGQFAQAIIKQKISNNTFVIQTDKPNVEVSWNVTGVRNDAWANENRVVPEKMKTGQEKGKYLHPELFGQPADKAIIVPNTKGISINEATDVKE